MGSGCGCDACHLARVSRLAARGSHLDHRGKGRAAVRKRSVVLLRTFRSDGRGAEERQRRGLETPLADRYPHHPPNRTSTGTSGLEARRTRLAPRPPGGRSSIGRSFPMVEVPRSASDEASRPRSPTGIRTTRPTEPAPAQAVSRLAARGSHLDHRGDGTSVGRAEALDHRGARVDPRSGNAPSFYSGPSIRWSRWTAPARYCSSDTTEATTSRMSWVCEYTARWR